MKKLLTIILAFIIVLSFAACGGEEEAVNNGSEYWGFYSTGFEFLEIFSDGTFQILDLDGNITATGTCDFTDGLTITAEDGQTLYFTLDENGDLYGGEDVGTLTRIREDEEPEDLPNGDDGGNTEGNGTAVNYDGYWMLNDGSFFMVEGDEWYYYGYDEELNVWGNVEIDEDGAWLMNDDSSYFTLLSLIDGEMTAEGEALTYYSEYPYTAPNGEEDYAYLIVDEWYYSDQEYVLYLYEDYTFALEDESYTDYGTFSFDGSRLVLYQDDSPVLYADYDVVNDIIIPEDEGGNYFFRSSDF